jgi:hypothetical protein
MGSRRPFRSADDPNRGGRVNFGWSRRPGLTCLETWENGTQGRLWEGDKAESRYTRVVLADRRRPLCFAA